MSALLIVDLQNDFCYGGAYPSINSLEIIPLINRIRKKFDTVIFSQDWHPKIHTSFKEYGGGYPKHCIQNTYGADLNNGLSFSDKDIIIKKGTYETCDSSSVFYDGTVIDKRTILDNVLMIHKIREIYIVGIGVEEVIFSTALDALKFGYKCKIIGDCVSYFDKENGIKSIEFLKTLGIEFVKSSSLI